MNISSIFFQMLILFATIAVGFAAGKLKLVGPDFNRNFSNLVIYFTSPAMVIHSVIGSERVLSNNQVFLLTGIALLSYVLLIALAYVLPAVLRVEKSAVGTWRFMCIFANIGFMGFPVVQALFGAEAVFFAAIFQIPFNLLCFTYGTRLIAGEKMGRIRPRQFLTPMVIATALAYVLYLCDWSAPGPLIEFCDFVGRITSPGAMIVVGVSLAGIRLGSLFTDWRVYVMSFVKLIVLPIAVCLALRPFVANELMLGITVIMLAMPVANTTTMLCAQYDGDHVTAAKGVFLSTLLSVATIPFLMWVLF